MSDDKIKFQLDLDANEFLEKGLQAKGVIQSIGDKENLSELLEGLTKTSLILGTVGLAAFSVKKAIDFTLEAESIQRVEKQFETLSEQAGISSVALKEGLEKSSKGLVDTSDLLEVANKKIVAMGADAAKLPDIMDLATKASQVYGGTALQNFDEISTAIANGNTRMLKHKGILVDAQKAVQDYANANGIAVNAISEAGKRQAILNAALEQGQKAFAGVEVDLNTATNTIEVLKTTLKDLGEAFILTFEKTVGPSVRTAFSALSAAASSAKTSLIALFGDGLEKNQAIIKQTESKIGDLKQQLIDIQFMGQGGGIFDKLFKGTPEQQVKKIKDQIAQLTFNLSAYRTEEDRLAADAKKNSDAKSKLGAKELAEDKTNQQVKAQNAAKYTADVAKLDAAKLKLQTQNINTLQDVDNAVRAQRLADEEAYNAEILKIKNAQDLDTTQKAELQAKVSENYHLQEKTRQQEASDFRKKLLDNYVKNSTDALDGIGRAFQAHAEQAKLAMQDMGKRGEDTFSSIQSNSVSAFEAMGAAIVKGQNVAEAAGQAMLKVFLGVIADRAIAEGSMLLLSGLWPPNPVSLGAGAGLIALGGALKAVGGSVGGGVSVPQSSATSASSSIDSQTTSTKIDIAKQNNDYEQEAQLRRQQLQQEQDASNKDIQDKKDISEQEKSDLIAKNDALYDLKRQQLENDLKSDADQRTSSGSTKASIDSVGGGSTVEDLQAGMIVDQSQLIADQKDRNDTAEAAELDNIKQAGDDDKQRQADLADAALQSQKDAQDKIDAQLADHAAAQLALQTAQADQTQAATSGSQFSQDQQLADTATQAGQRQKVVQIHIAGNYMDTDQTRRQLMEMIRQETDATDFTYNKIGV